MQKIAARERSLCGASDNIASNSGASASNRQAIRPVAKQTVSCAVFYVRHLGHSPLSWCLIVSLGNNARRSLLERLVFLQISLELSGRVGRCPRRTDLIIGQNSSLTAVLIALCIHSPHSAGRLCQAWQMLYTHRLHVVRSSLADREYSNYRPSDRQRCLLLRVSRHHHRERQAMA